MSARVQNPRMQSPRSRFRLFVLAALGLAGALLLGGCAVVTVAGTAVSVGAGAVGLAADAAIGTARITGKAVGAAADAVIPDSD